MDIDLFFLFFVALAFCSVVNSLPNWLKKRGLLDRFVLCILGACIVEMVFNLSYFSFIIENRYNLLGFHNYDFLNRILFVGSCVFGSLVQHVTWFLDEKYQGV